METFTITYLNNPEPQYWTHNGCHFSFSPTEGATVDGMDLPDWHLDSDGYVINYEDVTFRLSNQMELPL